MKTLKEKQKKEFDALNRVTITFTLDKYPNHWVTEGKGDLRTEIKFENTYNKEHWLFASNSKRIDDKKAFYMSNAIAQQFEMCFEHNGWDLTLPKTITRHYIVSESGKTVLEKHKKDYRSKVFMNEFLNNTVNGKSTKHITDALGMRIDKLVVMRKKDFVDSLPDDVEATCMSVVCHTSPDWNIYGEMD